MVSSREALEIDAVVTEILANVAKHAGPTARAWVLLEHEGRELIISLADNGVGAKRRTSRRRGERGHIGVRDSVLAGSRPRRAAVVRAAPAGS